MSSSLPRHCVRAPTRVPDEVIKRALELLHERDTWLAENRAKIEEGLAAAQRGEMIDSDQVRAHMEEKKLAWLAEQRKARAAISSPLKLLTIFSKSGVTSPAIAFKCQHRDKREPISSV